MSDKLEVLQAKYNSLVLESERHKTIADSLNFASVELRRKLSSVEQEVVTLRQSEQTRLQTIDSLSKVISKFEADKVILEKALEDANSSINSRGLDLR
eukprot:gene16013-33675_t